MVWEWDIAVPIKYFWTCIILHPTGQSLAGQSLDNQIESTRGSGVNYLYTDRRTAHKLGPIIFD
eukprot:scaffold403595_cov51-Attheya_sp.AAC.2